MIGLSQTSKLPAIDLWLEVPNISPSSVAYAKKFIEDLGSTADKFEWNLLNLSGDDKLSIVSGYYADVDSGTVIILNFHANGECQFHATTAEHVFKNTCYLDTNTDDWLAVQTTVDTIKRLV